MELPTGSSNGGDHLYRDEEEPNDLLSLYAPLHDSFLKPGSDLGVDPLLMNAFNNVNLAASCILTSTEYARYLGIAESKWIYPLGGAGTQDSDNCRYTLPCMNMKHMAQKRDHTVWERPNFHSSPAISRSLDACLDVSDLAKEEIDLFDFYS